MLVWDGMNKINYLFSTKFNGANKKWRIWSIEKLNAISSGEFWQLLSKNIEAKLRIW